MRQPIEHSQGPWVAINTAIYEATGQKIAIASDCQIAGRKWDANSELMAAAPRMYLILRDICNEDRATRAVGMLEASILLEELEGSPHAES